MKGRARFGRKLERWVEATLYLLFMIAPWLLIARDGSDMSTALAGGLAGWWSVHLGQVWIKYYEDKKARGTKELLAAIEHILESLIQGHSSEAKGKLCALIEKLEAEDAPVYSLDSGIFRNLKNSWNMLGGIHGDEEKEALRLLWRTQKEIKYEMPTYWNR